MARAAFLVRHGDRLDFAEPRWSASAQRPHDPPLSPDGVAQVRALARRLRPERIAHVFSSPFLRCVETAVLLAEATAGDVKIEQGLSEWLSAEWFPSPPATCPPAELYARFPRIDRAYESRGGARWGESGEDALRRSGDTAVRLAAQFAGDLLLVGHGASIRGATAGLLGVPAAESNRLLPEEIPCASLVRLAQRDERWTLELACDVSHLACRAEAARYR
ncbi:MAG: histidine phosphatase family protein [Thermodesulfobacteriota bacterium]